MIVLRKLSRSSLRAWAIGHVRSKQGGLCSICKKEINLKVMGNKSDYVVDHCHESGEIRGVLHRSCNSAEGKVINAAGRWGAKSMKYEDVIPYLRNLVEYLELANSSSGGTGLMYPDHKSPEQKLEAAKAKRRKSDALRRAKERVKQQEQN